MSSRGRVTRDAETFRVALQSIATVTRGGVAKRADTKPDRPDMSARHESSTRSVIDSTKLAGLHCG